MVSDFGSELAVADWIDSVDSIAEDGDSLARAGERAPMTRCIDTERETTGDGEACSGVNDALELLSWLFLGRAEPPCRAACDPDGNGELELADFQKASPLFDEGVMEITLESAVAARDVPGGTAPDRVRQAIVEAKQLLADAGA